MVQSGSNCRESDSFRVSVGHLGVPWGSLGVPEGSLGSTSGAFGEHLEVPWGSLVGRWRAPQGSEAHLDCKNPMFFFFFMSETSHHFLTFLQK